MWWSKPDSPNSSHLFAHTTWFLILPIFRSPKQHKYKILTPSLGRLVILSFLSGSIRLFGWNMRCEQKELLKQLGSAPAHWVPEFLWTLMALFAWIKRAGIPHGFLIYFQQMETWCYMTRRKWKRGGWSDFCKQLKTPEFPQKRPCLLTNPLQFLTTPLQLLLASESRSIFRHIHIFVPFGF